MNTHPIRYSAQPSRESHLCLPLCALETQAAQEQQKPNLCHHLNGNLTVMLPNLLAMRQFFDLGIVRR